MALSAGVISATELNTEFQAYTTALDTSSALGGKSFQYVVDVLSAISTSNVGLRTLDFVAPDDLELRSLHLALYSSGTDNTATVTLTAIAVNATGTESTVSDPTLRQTISLSQFILGSLGATESLAGLDLSSSTATRFMLVKGVTYRLQLVMDLAVTLDRVVASMTVKARRRRA